MDPVAVTVARLEGDAGVLAVTGSKVGGGAQVIGGWPWEELTEDTLPQVTVTEVVTRPVRDIYADAVVQADLWVWPTGASGGPETMETLHAAVLAALHERTWTHDPGGTHLKADAYVESSRLHASPPNRAMRRTIRIALGLSPAVPA